MEGTLRIINDIKKGVMVKLAITIALQAIVFGSCPNHST